MEIYLINSIMKKTKLLGYRLIDLEQYTVPANILAAIQTGSWGERGYTLELKQGNRTAIMEVPIDKLKKTMSSNKIKIMNATYKSNGTLAGTDYRIERDIELMENKHNVIMLKNDPVVDGNYITVCFLNHGKNIVVQSATLNELMDIMNNNMFNVMNKDYCNVKIYSDIQKVVGAAGLPEYDALNEKALNPNKNLTLEEFDTFMFKHNWTYSIKKTKDDIMLYDIDPKCTIVHIPDKVQSISNLFRERPTVVIQKLIIGNGIKLIQSMYNNAAKGDEKVKINELYFRQSQEKGIYKDYMYDNDETVRMMDGISNVHLNKLMNIQCNYKLRNALSESIIEHISDDVFNECCMIFGCFNNSVINCDFLINSLNIQYSFNNCVFNNESGVWLGENVNNIIRSFNNDNEPSKRYKLRIMGTNIRGIEASFNRSVYTGRTLNLSYETLVTLSSSFKYIPELEVCHINDSASLSDDLFYGSEIKEIEVSKGTRRVTFTKDGENQKVIFGSDVDELSSILLNRYTGKEDVEFKCDNIKHLYGNLMTLEGNILDCKLPTTIEMLSSNAFEASRLTIFDSQAFPKIDQLMSRFLLNSTDLHTIILRDNIKYVDKEEVFKGCTGVKHFVIGRNVADISQKLIKEMGAHSNMEVYVVKGSPAHKKLAKAKGINLIVVSTTDEAVDTVYSKISDNDKMFKRMKLIGDSNESVKQLLNGQYKSNIKEAYVMIQTLQNPDELLKEQRQLQIDKSQFKPLPLKYCSNIECYHANTTKEFTLKWGYGDIESKYNAVKDNQFAAMVKLITKLSMGNMNSKLDEELLIQIDNSIYDIDYVCATDTSSILYITLDNYAHLLCICQGDELVYTTPFERYQYEKCVRGRQSLMTMSAHSNYMASELVYVKKGDKFNVRQWVGITLNGIKIPEDMHSKVLSDMVELTYIIGFKGAIYNKLVNNTESYLRMIKGTVYLLDTISGYIMECKGEFDISQSGIESCTNFGVSSVTDIMDDKAFSSIIKYMGVLRESFIDEENKHRMIGKIYRDNKIETLRNDERAHDLDGNKELIDLSEEVHSYNYYDISCMVYDNNIERVIKTLDKILNTSDLYKKTSDFEGLGGELAIKIKHTGLSGYTLYKNIFVIHTKRMGVSKIGIVECINIWDNEKQKYLYDQFKVGILKIDEVIKMLGSCGKTMEQGVYTPLLKISNTPIERMGQFYGLDRGGSYYYSLKKIWIDMTNCDAYIFERINDDNDTWIPYLRFKSLWECIKYDVAYGKGMGTAADGRISTPVDFEHIRELIIAGYPNKVPYKDFNSENYAEDVQLLNLLAKQMPQ